MRAQSEWRIADTTFMGWIMIGTAICIIGALLSFLVTNRAVRSEFGAHLEQTIQTTSLPPESELSSSNGVWHSSANLAEIRALYENLDSAQLTLTYDHLIGAMVELSVYNTYSMSPETWRTINDRLFVIGMLLEERGDSRLDHVMVGDSKAQSQ